MPKPLNCPCGSSPVGQWGICAACEGEIRATIINAPETADFISGIAIEAMHQRDRWGAAHDAGKNPFDWFWLIGYLSQKAAEAHLAGDLNKAKHHTISTAAALANWHSAICGINTQMRPGIDPVERGYVLQEAS